ncbi:MAG: Na+/H+ antiporter subunit G [Planctomycetes bacterium]|nr:Na+/H+ antiporter subunit G [Planctomycetota bacterium]
MNEYIGVAIVIVGLAFDVFGCVGLVRLPDIYTRLQAATKCVTLGTCMILIGIAILTGLNATGVKALVCMAFVLITSPTAAHAIARGAYKFGVKLEEPTVVDRYAETQTDEGRS